MGRFEIDCHLQLVHPLGIQYTHESFRRYIAGAYSQISSGPKMSTSELFPQMRELTKQNSEKKQSFVHTKSLSQPPKIECLTWR